MKEVRDPDEDRQPVYSEVPTADVDELVSEDRAQLLRIQGVPEPGGQEDRRPEDADRYGRVETDRQVQANPAP